MEEVLWEVIFFELVYCEFLLGVVCIVVVIEIGDGIVDCYGVCYRGVLLVWFFVVWVCYLECVLGFW